MKLKNKSKISFAICLIILIHLSIGVYYTYGASQWYPSYVKTKGKRSVEDVVKLYGPHAENRLSSKFALAKVHYPPSEVTFIAFKDKKVLDVWAKGEDSKYSKVASYDVKGASGKLGPKLMEGDYQIPEGIYKIIGFNPNSRYHLSMKLNYPNPFDQKYAKIEGRENPGNNIFIHGKSVSIGCLAMGDTAIEELFILSEKVGVKNITVIISPTNLAGKNNMEIISKAKPLWVKELYKDIKLDLEKYYNYSSNKTLKADSLKLAEAPR